MFLGEKVFQPAVLHFELGDASLQRGILLGCLADSAFENLLTLLLLHAEASTGGRVTAATVLFRGTADALLLIEGGGDAVAGDGGAVLGVAHLAVGRGDGRGDIGWSESAWCMAELVGRIWHWRVDGVG